VREARKPADDRSRSGALGVAETDGNKQ
jgi:hypothetical protein